ncbi:MAG: hypothetical protein HXY37_11670 [Chloroflexi bacterium]|nr:hypothetical protein [Chloroflexota bacterium]
MRRWKAQASWRLWVALVALLAAAGAALYLGLGLFTALAQPPERWPIDVLLFAHYLAFLALLLLAAGLAYRVAAMLTLAYSVDRNGLYIHWLGNRAIVPLGQIENIESGASLTGGAGLRVANIGAVRSQLHLPGGRVIHAFSTVPLAQALVVHMPDDSYAISPRDADAFVQDLEQRRRIGAVQQLTPGVEAGRIFAYAFWSDPLVRNGLAGAVLLNLLLLGLLMTLFPGLPPLVELRTDAVGATAALAPRHQILFLPLAGAAVTLLNVGLGLWLYQREPVGVRMLQLASALIQVLFIIAALSILG